MMFSNETDEMIDVYRHNGKYDKIGQFLAKDILEILIEEKPTLKDYDTIKIVKVYLNSFKYDENGRLPQQIITYQVSISCMFKGFVVGGSEYIEDLPQKIRQRKLEKILNE